MQVLFMAVETGPASRQGTSLFHWAEVSPTPSPDMKHTPRERTKIYQATPTLHLEERPLEPIQSIINPPPPEPAPWTATPRQWAKWVELKEKHQISLEREARAEEDLRGVF